jgi:hypothetical protein
MLSSIDATNEDRDSNSARNHARHELQEWLNALPRLSGARIPEIAYFCYGKKYECDSEDAYKAGVEFAIRQCEDLISQGFRFLHFFTMNKSNASWRYAKPLKVRYPPEVDDY